MFNCVFLIITRRWLPLKLLRKSDCAPTRRSIIVVKRVVRMKRLKMTDLKRRLVKSSSLMRRRMRRIMMTATTRLIGPQSAKFNVRVTEINIFLIAHLILQIALLVQESITGLITSLARRITATSGRAIPLLGAGESIVAALKVVVEIIVPAALVPPVVMGSDPSCRPLGKTIGAGRHPEETEEDEILVKTDHFMDTNISYPIVA